jgi:hypothetical protein
MSDPYYTEQRTKIAEYLKRSLASHGDVASVRQWEKHEPPTIVVEMIDGAYIYVEVRA